MSGFKWRPTVCGEWLSGLGKHAPVPKSDAEKMLDDFTERIAPTMDEIADSFGIEGAIAFVGDMG